MKALLQRVTRASVSVQQDEIAKIGPGLLIFICAMPNDTAEVADKMAAKIAKMRLFKDDEGKMNLSLAQTGNSALVVSQFTLAADTSRGNRPGFSGAAKPAEAETLYLQFVDSLRHLDIPVETGRFGADMAVNLNNDGPVTIWLDTDQT
ncbi:MAG: D-aminoacyl-tRNA deacylase [Roseobacter sp.]